MKPFERWTYEEVETVFGVKLTPDMTLLVEWEASRPAIAPDVQVQLEALRAELAEEIRNFNEDELKFFFIGTLMRLVNFKKQDRYKAFTQRIMEAKVPDVQGVEQKLRGRVEFVVATGKQTPHHPYFFLHEYKPERFENDPLGQLLISMVAAQALNADEQPVYGCYVLGRNWFFVVLNQKSYAVSDAYVATQDDLSRIYQLLIARKQALDTLFPN